MKQKNFDRLSLMAKFKVAPDDAWFNQKTIAAIRDCSIATIERDRWAGGGVPFVKCGRSVRYRKIDILRWLAKHTSVNSTSEAQQQSR